MILIAMFFNGNEGKPVAGAKPPEKFWGHVFQSKESALVDLKRDSKKGHFRSFAERGKSPDPQDTPS